MTRTHTEKTSAADKAIGFEYQYYHFLWRLLTLKSGETVGLEVMDDVHTELANNRQILVQLKHSTQTKPDGNVGNLTTLDSDLWKTISNWSKVITDSSAGRSKVDEQLKFVEKTDFLLVSNKSHNTKNSLLVIVRDFQAKKKALDDLIRELDDLSKKTKDDVIKGYIKDVLNLNKDVTETLFMNLSFDLGHDGVIQKCKTAIKEHHIDDSKIDEVFSGLDSRLRAENFSMVKQKAKIIISFDDFHQNYRIYFDRARNEKLVIKKFTGDLPDCLEDQKFIKQLIDIEDISSDDTELMAEFTRHLLYMQNNIDEWYKNGDITQEEISALKSEAKTRWANEYRKVYRGQYAESEITAKALNLLDEMRKQILPIASQDLPTDMSNGQFYDLSNTPEIGWHKDWEDKYK